MKARVLAPTVENIHLAAKALQCGEVVGMPTETVYGLAGDCRNPVAVARIFETKERPTFDPLIVHVSSQVKTVADLEQQRLVDPTSITPQMRQQAEELMKRFWPGPLTLILPKHPDILDLVTSGLPTIALRMPSHPAAQALIEAAGAPLAAPSANRFGRISPTSAEAVLEELGERISLILDGGSSQIGVESTVVSLDSNTCNPSHTSHTSEVRILRHGGTPKEAIEDALKISFADQPSSPKSVSPSGLLAPLNNSVFSPGMLESHYAPKKPLRLLPNTVDLLTPLEWGSISPLLDRLPACSAVGLLLIQGDPARARAAASKALNRPVLAHTLSLRGDLHEAAKNLFAKMRELDSGPSSDEVAMILAEPCLSQFGLGYAIADRLKRASAR